MAGKEIEEIRRYKRGQYSSYRTYCDLALVDVMNGRECSIQNMEAAMDELKRILVMLWTKQGRQRNLAWMNFFCQSYCYFSERLRGGVVSRGLTFVPAARIIEMAAKKDSKRGMRMKATLSRLEKANAKILETLHQNNTQFQPAEIDPINFSR